MKKEAILHIPLSQYAYSENEHRLAIRIRTARDDIRECALFFGDRCFPGEKIEVTKLPMKVVGSDQIYDYFETIIDTDYTRVCYYFELRDDSQSMYYCERGLVDDIDVSRTEYFQFPFIRREEICRIPEWAKDMVMYHIFPDSFASGKRTLANKPVECRIPRVGGGISESVTRLGGTLEGVIQNVDYLAEMGINCIYLNPVFAANSYHKYDTIDYFDIDPCFGTKGEMIKLVNICHEHGIRVIFDGVFNHCGPDFFAFADVLKKGRESKYFDWFYDLPDKVEYADPPNYAAFAYVKEMPKLNTSNPELEEYLIRVGTYWIQEVGIDGWRLDVANEINHDFWRHFKAAIRKVKPDALMIGEIWEDSWIWLMGDQMDSTMNYRFTYLCTDFFAKQSMSVSDFDQSMQKMICRYPTQVSLAQMNFLDSHDVPRFLSYCNGDRGRMRLAFFYLFMGYGVPSVFYGDEHYLSGVTEAEYRQAMPWDNEDNAYEDFKCWIKLRNTNSCLRNGSYSGVYVDDDNRIYAFCRENEKQRALIVMNNSDKEYKVSQQLSEAVAEYCISIEAGTVIEPYGYMFEVLSK
ncbi:MAG: glycoside hydrolase family 13 protein [Agathobacter sp.]|nr:glycoside hydrolase family 13 protein [Agathobacter sp.]